MDLKIYNRLWVIIHYCNMLISISFLLLLKYCYCSCVFFYHCITIHQFLHCNCAWVFTCIFMLYFVSLHCSCFHFVYLVIFREKIIQDLCVLSRSSLFCCVSKLLNPTLNIGHIVILILMIIITSWGWAGPSSS